MQGMELGMSSYGLDAGAAAAVALAQRAEAAGFDRFMLVERVLTNDTLTTLAGAATVTSTIRLGTGIANIHLRHPGMLAVAASAVCDLSNGRLILGLGPNNRSGTEKAGLPWRDPRVALLEITAQLRESFAGTGGRCGPAPHPIPIPWAAVAMETAELAGTHADGAMLYLATPERIAKVRDRFRSGAEAAGRSPDQLEFSLLLPTFIDDDLEVARDAARSFLRPYASMAHYHKLFRSSGFDDPDSLPDSLLDAVLLVGDQARARDRIAELASLGLTHLDLAPLPVAGRTIAQSAEVLIAMQR